MTDKELILGINRDVKDLSKLNILLKIIVFIIWIVIAIGFGMIYNNKRVMQENVKHGVMYKSNQNGKFYWYDEFIILGIDHREVE